MPPTAPPTRPGMGAIPGPDSTTFRVWAPHGRGVAVAGDFNEWSHTTHSLRPEGNGYWAGDVAGMLVGNRYKYVVGTHDGHHLRTDPYARSVRHSNGASVVDDGKYNWGDHAFYMPPWNELVLYEIHIGTFNDEPGGSPGDLHRAIERLGHVADLGANAVQLMPPTEFAGGFSWGYNPAHLFAIETDYGGPRAFKDFVREAHRLGLAVIFDGVYNHFGPSDLDLWRFDGWHEGEGGGIYFYNDWRARTPWGNSRPDYGRPEVRQFIRDNVLMWLEEYRLDGIRWDATAYIRDAHGHNGDSGSGLADGWNLLRWVNDEINARQPWKISIAEDLRDNAWVTRESPRGGAGFDAQWCASFVHPVRDAVITPDDAHRNMASVREAIEHRYNADAFERVIYTESHDEVANGKARVPEEVWPGHASGWHAKKRSSLGAAIVMTSPGIPMIFQGQEFLEDEWFRDHDPIDWSKRERFAGIVRLYRDLIRLRRNWFDTTRGLKGQHVRVHHVNDRDKVIAFERWDRGGPRDSVVVLANFSHRPFSAYRVGFPRAGEWKVRLNSDWRGYDHEFAGHPSHDTYAHAHATDGMPASGEVGIGSYSAVILSQDR